MRALVILAAALAMPAGMVASDGGAVALDTASGLGDWKPIVDSLAARGPIVARFTESRFFPFRFRPTVLHGILRLSPENGLSLEYTDPEHYVLIADAHGILVREADGRTREPPSGSHESGAVAALLPIMRFDLSALRDSFGIRGIRSGETWTLTFTPRDPGLADTLGEISVGGAGPEVRHLEFKRSPSQRIEIDVSQTTAGTVFGPKELAAYFR
jgi:hypothetical protein